jgi:hypothetical protein
MNEMNDDEQNSRLENALKGLARDRIFVPPTTDEKMVEAIREQFQKTSETAVLRDAPKSRPSRRQQKYWQKWMPLAASIAIAGCILYFSRPLPDPADINRDGSVNVIDALILAEQMRAGGGRDVNGDDTVSEADATEIAVRAVDLERSGS